MVKKKKRNIVVLGSGFAGIRAVQDLANNLEDKNYQIILVNKYHSHVFKADLYEVAAAYNEEITKECLINLKDTVATRITDLIDEKKVEFICDKVVDINHQDRKIILKEGGDLHYDYLAVCLGTRTNYFNIPGLKENSFGMIGLTDSLAVNCHIDHYFQKLWGKEITKNIHINIGGGGATGVETVSELVGCIKRICAKYNFSYKKVKLQLIEGSDKLCFLDKKGTDIILKRLRKLGVKVFMNTFITEAGKNFVKVKNDGKVKKLDSDILIWTGGVMVNPVVQKSIGDQSKRGAVLVNPYMQSYVDRNIFAAGDNAFFPDSEGNRMPMMAQAAYHQADIMAKNIINLTKGKEMKKYKPSGMKYLITVGSKFALYYDGKRYLKGFIPWLLKRFVYFKYMWSIMSFGKAYRKLHHSMKIFAEND